MHNNYSSFITNHSPLKTDFLLYTAPNGDIKVEAFLQNETIWLSQQKISQLFGKVKSTISEHLKNIFLEGELEENAVVRNFRTTASDGKTYNTNFYNLDAILSVGYRVNSIQATHFRIWATKTLKEYDEFNKTQKINSDFENQIKLLSKGDN